MAEPEHQPMKMLITVVHRRDNHAVTRALLAAGYSFTVMASTGGFLREGNVTLLLGVSPAQLDEVLRIIEENSRTREQFVNVMPPEAGTIGAFVPTPVRISVGGAIVFVLDVEQFHRF